MKIRNKILIYFSSTVVVLTAVSLIIVFILFSAHREEEFQQRQFSKIKYTIGLVDQFGKMSEEISMLLDEQDINDFYDEKMLIYDAHKNLIFSSIDSLDIEKSQEILNQLSSENFWIETKEDNYDLIGVYVVNNSNEYYGISKAYDYFGYSKKDFLKKVLVAIFSAVVFVVLLISFILSNLIARPIWELTKKIEEYDLNDESDQMIEINTNTSEFKNLSIKFNELIKRTNETFLFHKYSIQHISHELRTPIAVLVSELEKMENLDDIDKIKLGLNEQRHKAKSLGNTINILLQISKIDAGQEVNKTLTRIDELIFNNISEITSYNPDFNFEVQYIPDNFNEKILNISVNEELIKQAFMNLLANAVYYSNNKKAKIILDGTTEVLKVRISNSGETLSEKEQEFLFSHFFRGENSKNRQGFGLGLALSQKIFIIHNATIEYTIEDGFFNVFIVKFA
ncbi:MAG: ATP-binding protein [Bacteroidales bacterium]|jgi:signal transduction histidine kinase|nr:HAMP domain-containing histidine kinase [Bacteroidales bacterium]